MQVNALELLISLLLGATVGIVIGIAEPDRFQPFDVVNTTAAGFCALGALRWRANWAVRNTFLFAGAVLVAGAVVDSPLFAIVMTGAAALAVVVVWLRQPPTV